MDSLNRSWTYKSCTLSWASEQRAGPVPARQARLVSPTLLQPGKTLLNDCVRLVRHASKIRTASNSRKIKVIGRFASPQRSREVSPTLSLDDSSDSDSCHTARASRPGLDSQNDADMEIDPNDADDEAESKAMDMRGRTRRTRQISLSRHL